MSSSSSPAKQKSPYPRPVPIRALRTLVIYWWWTLLGIYGVVIAVSATRAVIAHGPGTLQQNKTLLAITLVSSLFDFVTPRWWVIAPILAGIAVVAGSLYVLGEVALDDRDRERPYRELHELFIEIDKIQPQLRQIQQKWEDGHEERRRTLPAGLALVNTVQLGDISVMAMSPTEPILAYAGFDATITLHDTRSDATIATLTGHTEQVNCITWSPDGGLIASGGNDGSVRLWESTTGMPHQTLQGHTDWVRWVAWSPDGRMIASVGDDATVRLWESATGTLFHTITGQKGWMLSVAWSPDGHRLAAAGADKTIFIWDLSLLLDHAKRRRKRRRNCASTCCSYGPYWRCSLPGLAP